MIVKAMHANENIKQKQETQITIKQLRINFGPLQPYCLRLNATHEIIKEGITMSQYNTKQITHKKPG